MTQCAVVALAGSSFSFWPSYGALNGKQRKDYENDPDCRDSNGDLIQRWVRMDLSSAKVHDPESSDHGGDGGSEPMFAYAGLPPVDPGDDLVSHAKVSVFDGTDTYLSSGSFGVPYCNYLKFDTEWDSETDNLEITAASGVVHVKTQAGPENVGQCFVEGEPEPIWLHLDIAYDVRDQ